MLPLFYFISNNNIKQLYLNDFLSILILNFFLHFLNLNFIDDGDHGLDDERIAILLLALYLVLSFGANIQGKIIEGEKKNYEKLKGDLLFFIFILRT